MIKHHNGHAIVMEDIGGVDLKKLQQNKKIDLKTSLSLGIRIAEALRQIHNNHIIHKDIKPDNIVCTQDLNDVRVIDFSISTQLSRERQSLINEYILEGTLAYISPEQTGRMNRDIDYRTDFYSLGVLLYELLTGDLPFQAKDALGMIHQHIAGELTAPHIVDSSIPEVLSAIIIKLLSKNAED